MSYRLTPAESVEAARPRSAASKRRGLMRYWPVAAVLPALFVCNVAVAQVGAMATPTPTIGATSPLGITTNSSVAPTGIPLGSTELASPGISPMPGSSTGTITIPGSSTACSTVGTSPSGMFGSTTSFDGGGMAIGSGTPSAMSPSAMSMSGTSATSGMSTTSGIPETSGLSGMCGSGSSSVASSSTATSPTTPGGAARTGIPLGSTEIGSLGVSSAAPVPTMGVSPTVGAIGEVPTVPTVASPPTVSSPMTTSNFPCPTTGLRGTNAATGGC